MMLGSSRSNWMPLVTELGGTRSASLAVAGKRRVMEMQI
jgi:hypothetical protein